MKGDHLNLQRQSSPGPRAWWWWPPQLCGGAFPRVLHSVPHSMPHVLERPPLAFPD